MKKKQKKEAKRIWEISCTFCQFYDIDEIISLWIVYEKTISIMVNDLNHVVSCYNEIDEWFVKLYKSKVIKITKIIKRFVTEWETKKQRRRVNQQHTFSFYSWIVVSFHNTTDNHRVNLTFERGIILICHVIWTI